MNYLLTALLCILCTLLLCFVVHYAILCWYDKKIEFIIKLAAAQKKASETTDKKE